MLFVASAPAIYGQAAPSADGVVVAADAATGEAAPAFQVRPEAKTAVEQGAKMLQQERYKQAIDAFTAAARIHPEVAQFRHLLGVAYFKNKQLGPAWLQFRQAVLRNPGSPEIVRDFTGVWNMLDSQGLMGLGLTTEQVEKHIGKPDREQKKDNVTVWTYGFMQVNFVDGKVFSTVDPRGLDTQALKPLENVRFKLDGQQWRPAYRTVNRNHTLTEYIRLDQTLQNWQEMFNVQRLVGLTAGGKTPVALMETIKEKLGEANPDFHFQMLQNTGSSVIFEWRVPKKEKRNGQHELVRLFAGEKDIHRIAYVRQVEQLAPEERATWLDFLKNAELGSVVQANPEDAAGDAVGE